MKKMAIFVEGQTEQQFVESLIYAIAGRQRVHVDSSKGRGGKLFPRHFIEINASRPDPEKLYYVAIYDSACDSRVLSDIRDRYESLQAQEYSEIIGLRDLYPLSRMDECEVRDNFSALTPSGIVPVTLSLAIMEIEAWFIAESSHFWRVNSSLTHQVVCDTLGYDPSKYDVRDIDVPSQHIQRVYSVAGIGYNKSRRHVERTVQSLDYAITYLELTRRIPDLDTLVSCIDRFLL